MRESAATVEKPDTEGKALRLVPAILDIDSPHLEAELARAREKTHARWPVAFVMDAIRSGRAAAFRLVENGEHLAWIVVERLASFEVVLNVWVMVGAGLGMQHRDGLVALLDRLASMVGARGWRAEGREGWQRVLHGVSSRTFTVYERDL